MPKSINILKAATSPATGILVLATLALLFFFPPSTLTVQPASLTNRVLELDGKNSFVELPPNIFNDLDEAKVEGWIKWEGDVGSTSVSALASELRNHSDHRCQSWCDDEAAGIT